MATATATETLKVLPELAKYLPVKPAVKKKELENDLQVSGCLQPISIWKRDDDKIILDGHNRYEFCKKHDIPFKTITVSGMASLDHAKQWMINNLWGQQYTRTMTEAELLRLTDEYEKLETKIAATKKKAGVKSSTPAANGKRAQTAAQVAAAKVTKATGKKVTATKLEIRKKLKSKAPEIFELCDGSQISFAKGNDLYTVKTKHPAIYKEYEAGKHSVDDAIRLAKKASKPAAKKPAAKKPATKTDPVAECNDALGVAIDLFEQLSQVQKAEVATHYGDAINELYEHSMGME